MAEIIGMGLSHYPGPLVPVEFWPQMLETNVEKGRIPRELFEDRNKWPKEMLAELGSDNGQTAARAHQARLLAAYRELRKRLDAFKPDVVLIWGDDQYENFRKDGIPAFCVYIFDQQASTPLMGGSRGPFRTERNSWDLPVETELNITGHREAAAGLVRHLLTEQFDPAYAFEARSERGLSHAFTNTVLFLDYDRKGFNYPVIPFHINCYGSQIMTTAARQKILSPPSPTPQRCFDIGQAVAKYFRDSPWRVALIGSSSWSHASLTEKHQRLYPDLETDRARLKELQSRDYGRWANLSLDQIEKSGQNEFLNWICLAGAMAELDYDVEIVDYVESYVFNSSKCFAAFTPKKSQRAAA
jgi:hypothetical protein